MMNINVLNDIFDNPKDPRLAAYLPDDFKHRDKYPMTLANTPSKPVPVQIGIPWFRSFGTPTKDKDGKWWVGKDKNNLGPIDGGHSITIPQNLTADLIAWWDFYDQGNYGACVGFAGARMMSLLNRERYDAMWNWDRAKEKDEWDDTNPGDNNGTSVNAMHLVLRTLGAKLVRGKKQYNPDVNRGIIKTVWANSFDDVLAATQNNTYQKLGAVPWINNWGRSYPHFVWMPGETHNYIIKECYGEYGIPTDR